MQNRGTGDQRETEIKRRGETEAQTDGKNDRRRLKELDRANTGKNNFKKFVLVLGR